MGIGNGNEQLPGDEGNGSPKASFGRRAKAIFAAGKTGPALREDQPGPIVQGLQRGLKNLGLSPEGIDYVRLGEVMEQAVSAGLKDYASSASVPQPAQVGRPKLSGQSSQSQPPKFHGFGSRAMLGLAGMTLLGRMGSRGPGMAATPDIESDQGGGLGDIAQTMVRAQMGQTTQVVPGAAPQGARLLPGAAQAAEGVGGGGAASVATGATTGAAGEAAAGGGLRAILGAGMMGYSAGGMGGALEGVAGEMGPWVSGPRLPVGSMRE